MAAERKAISGKLKLVISYNDENDNLCEKSVQMRNLVTGVEPANVITAVNALDRGGGPKGRRGCSSHHTKERRNYHGHQIGNENVTAHLC